MQRLSNSHRINGVRIEEASIPTLDGLRALACLAVFGVHFQQHTRLHGELGPFAIDTLLKNGNTGVALFFALSGFLLSRPFWSTNRSVGGFPDLAIYWSKRLTRIVPAYFLCLTLLIVLNRRWQSSDAWVDIPLHYLFVFNYREASIFSLNPPFWTLAVEMQFYLLLPLLLFPVSRARDGVVLTWCLVLCVVSYLAHYTLITVWADPSSNVSPQSALLHYSLLAHLPHFLLGVIGSQFFGRLKDRSVGYHPTFSIAAEVTFWGLVFVTLIILATPLESVVGVPFGRYNFPYIPIMLTGIILVAPFTDIAKALLALQPLQGLGRISYGVYIYHLPIQNATARYLAKFGRDAVEHWVLFGLISLALTVVVAGFSFVLIERPVILWVRKRVGARQLAN